MTINKPHLILYSREYCHLCQDLLAALENLRVEQGGNFEVSVVDIDLDPLLVSRYDELVPVLVAGTGDNARELCRYFLDVTAVRAYLAEFR